MTTIKTNSILYSILIVLLAVFSSCSKDRKGESQANVKAIVSQFDWYNFQLSSDPKFYQARIDGVRLLDGDDEEERFSIDEIVDKNIIAEAQVLVYACRIDWTEEPHARTFHRLPYTEGAKKISFANKGEY